MGVAGDEACGWWRTTMSRMAIMVCYYLVILLLVFFPHFRGTVLLIGLLLAVWTIRHRQPARLDYVSSGRLAWDDVTAFPKAAPSNSAPTPTW
jgi:hypothetical protein